MVWPDRRHSLMLDTRPQPRERNRLNVVCYPMASDILKIGKVHGDHNKPDHNSQEYHHDGFQQRRE